MPKAQRHQSWMNNWISWRRHFAVLTALFSSAFSGLSAEIIQVTWPTVHAASPLKLEASASDFLPAFRIALANLHESSIVTFALSQPALLGLTQEQAARLQPLTAQRYDLMTQSPYTNASSALPYCFSAQRPARGLANVYVPDHATTNTPVILFLHGYGGSFLWYQHYLSESFSNHIIICPAYGISAATIPQPYVAESTAAVSKRLGFPVSIPNLIGLSAGGFGACRLYVAAPQYYVQMICLGAYPTDDTVSRFTRDSRPRFLSGGAEPFVTSGDFQRRIERIRLTCPVVEAATIPGADHFFLLTKPKETVTHLRRWLSKDEPASSLPSSRR